MSKVAQDYGHHAFRILQVGLIAATILAGLDKFFYLMANWSQYISAFTLNMVNGHDRALMMTVGLIEIIAGVGLIFRPKIFSYIIAAWLLGIIVNLLMTGQYFDIVLRDIGLLLAALALGQLSQKYEKHPHRRHAH